MMLQDTDACDDSELVLAALALIDSVHPEDLQRHVWYSRGRWRQALERASPCVARLFPRQNGVSRRRDYGPTTRPCKILSGSLHMTMIIPRRALCS
eukprot:1594155-Pyramimonas_sp.AAC.1